MLIADDILTSPFRGLWWIFREIHHAVELELTQEADSITGELRSLYLMLEAGTLSSEEFDAREKILLDRLDILNAEDQS